MHQLVLDGLIEARGSLAMKRDMDLVRLIMLEIEGATSTRVGSGEISKALNYEKNVIEYHLTLLEEAKYVEGHISRPVPGGAGWHNGWRLTWMGCDFLDKVRDPEIWRSTKAAANQLGGFSVSLLADLAKAILLAKAKELGLLIS